MARAPATQATHPRRTQGLTRSNPRRVGIEERPAIVETRRRFGDWESDAIEGRKGSGLRVTHLERKSRYVRIGKLADKRAATFSSVTRSILADLPAKLRRTMTTDNGKEFSDFAAIEGALKVKVYFANPHARWERGTNENTDGLLRDYFPKGSDFSKITRTRLAAVQRMMNNRPRKCLNYRTPTRSSTPYPVLRFGIESALLCPIISSWQLAFDFGRAIGYLYSILGFGESGCK